MAMVAPSASSSLKHGAAVVALAALLNALRIVRKDIRKVRVAVTSVGAAGTVTIKILLGSGMSDIVGVDEHSILHRGRAAGVDFMKRWVASATNPRQVRGGLAAAVAGGVARAAHETGTARRRRVDLSGLR